MEKKNLLIIPVDENDIDGIEKEYRIYEDSKFEFIPLAENQTYKQLLTEIFMPHGNDYANYLIVSTHRSQHGMQDLTKKMNDFLTETNNSSCPMDIMSISSTLKRGQLMLYTLIRVYGGTFPDFREFFEALGDEILTKTEVTKETMHGRLLIPEELKDFKYTPEEIENYNKAIALQDKIYEESDDELPFLNRLSSYTPIKMINPLDYCPLIYDLASKDKELELATTYDNFIKVFAEVMTYVNGTERISYMESIDEDYGQGKKSNAFMNALREYIIKNYVEHDKFPIEDIEKLMAKLHRSLYQLYIVQDLIDDPDVSDIKLTDPTSIRARVKGNAYLSNITFLSDADYMRFVEMVIHRNNMSADVPVSTFTDQGDEDYLLRFSLVAGYVSSTGYPILHIRKVERKKMMAPELMKAGMFDEKIRDYLLDCGRHSKGVIFCGSPGSGKTKILNWFLEDAYEQSAEILVIQENDELFAQERKGVMFEHIVPYHSGMKVEPINLQGLGEKALVAGANVFIIGEVKGAEICDAMTLANSGCRTALTVHSDSAREAITKCADLAMRGYAQSMTSAKRALTCFQTVVFLDRFKVQEIYEIKGFDEKKEEVIFKAIYRNMEGES